MKVTPSHNTFSDPPFEDKTIPTITPTAKEIKQKAIVDIIYKYWWTIAIPLLIGVLLLFIEKNYFK